MARLEPLPRKDLTQYEPVFRMTEAFTGVMPNSLLTMASYKPALFEAFMNYSAIALRDDKVGQDLKQLVAHVVSNAAMCRYCQAHTAAHADRVGVPVEKIRAALDFETSPLFTDAERAALRVAHGAGFVPSEVTDEAFAEMRKHFDEEQVVEIVEVIAYFGHMNRWNDTMSTTLEQSPLAFARTMLTERGWEAGRHAPPQEEQGLGT